MQVTLYQEDCLTSLKDIPDGSIDLVVTDPPYKIVAGGNTTKNKPVSGILSRNKREVRNGKMFAHNEIRFDQWIPEVYRVLKNDSHCYIFINGRNLKDLQIACERAGFVFQNLLVWDKGNATPNKWYMNACEFILLLRKGRAKPIRDMGEKNLIEVHNIIGSKAHPAEKPIDLLKIFIKNSSSSGETVLDPFMGSGTTGIASVSTGRKFIGMESDEQYYEIAIKRIGSATFDTDLGGIECT